MEGEGRAAQLCLWFDGDEPNAKMNGRKVKQTRRWIQGLMFMNDEAQL